MGTGHSRKKGPRTWQTNLGVHLAQKAIFFCAFFLMTITIFVYFNRPKEPSDMLSLLRRLASPGMTINELYITLVSEEPPSTFVSKRATSEKPSL
jgi:hypothetical protein